MNEMIIFQTDDRKVSVDVRFDPKGETVWLTQQIAELFSTTKHNISYHVNNCFRESELNEHSDVKDFLTTAADGKPYHRTPMDLKTTYINSLGNHTIRSSEAVV